MSHDVTEEDLRLAFRSFGQVSFVNIIKNRFNTATPGFGLIEMPIESEAEAAITGLDGKELKGQLLNVNDARQRPRSSPQA